MGNISLEILQKNGSLTLKFGGEVTVYTINKYQNSLEIINTSNIKTVELNLEKVTFLDSAGALFLDIFEQDMKQRNLDFVLTCENDKILKTLQLVKNHKRDLVYEIDEKTSVLEKMGKVFYDYFTGFLSFLSFLGEMFITKLRYLKSAKTIRYKEIAYEINDSAIKALGIIIITSFLIGLVVAYQSAYQLKLYGANIFLVDMLGLSIFRELAPLITAIVVAGRSGSSYTAQIGAMKITEELDAMRTMGFDPYRFLVLPRIIALMISMPILIFVADMMGILGGMIVANVDLGISTSLFLDRFNEVISIKHFFVGLVKGPFFAFLIASIGIYRGLMVQNDTQSIGYNTTKSVVEAIFAVIVCDAIFSIMFTNLGI